MIKRLLGGFLLLAITLPACAAFDVGQLMNDLAKHKGGKARFVEKRFISLLDKPVISSGEMTYTAPDRLEKRTLVPKVETLLLDKDILSIEREKQKLSINLANQPEALAFVDSIRGTLSGNRVALEKNYALQALPKSGCSLCYPATRKSPPSFNASRSAARKTRFAQSNTCRLTVTVRS